MFCIKCKKCEAPVLFDMFSFEKNLTMTLHGFCIDCEIPIKKKMTFTKLCEMSGMKGWKGNGEFEKEIIVDMFRDFDEE